LFSGNNTKGLKDTIIGATKGLADIFENEVNNYAKKKKGIEEFKSSLSKFISDTNGGKPIIFIIDELDRCRPNYSVAILEQIKHFFSVRNIVFVLSIDKIQLGNAVRGVYGSDKIDADEYLRRFIDVEYSIPKPADDLFYNYLYEKLGYDSFLNSEERIKLGDFKLDKERFLRICKVLFNGNDISLRQQERIFVLARLSLRSFKVNNYLVPQVYLFLNFIKIVKNEFYNNLKSKKLSLDGLQREFLKIVQSNIDLHNRTELMFLEAYLLMFYQNYKSPPNSRLRLYETGKNFEDRKLLFHSILGENSDKEFLNVISNIETRDSNISDISLEHFLMKIDLLEQVSI
jgi:hypothetical protein